MTTHLPAGVPGPADRFALNPAATMQFLSRVRRVRNGFESPGIGDDWWSADADWDPRNLHDDDLPHLEQLVYCAIQAGAVTCPAGWDLQMIAMADPDQQSYLWRLAFWDEDVPHLGFTLASECLENTAIIGRDGTKGAVAALEVLREAVTCSNRILDGYAAAAARISRPDAALAGR